jgi:1,4-dihydroxy-2-naphthoyl-CoA hydrolase
VDASPFASEAVRGAVDLLAAGGTLEGPRLEALGGVLDDAFGSRTVGLVWDLVAADRGVAHLDVTPAHHQPAGIVHGGVWCAVVESMASVLAALHALRDGRVCVGVHNATDFLRPVSAGRVEGVATPLQVGRTQHLWLVELHRAEDGRAVARGQVRLAVVDPAGR